VDTTSPRSAWVLTTRCEFGRAAGDVLDRCRELSPPWFVKTPISASSVGISRVDSPTSHQGDRLRLGYDRRVLIEEGAQNAREIEVALLGNDTPEASTVGEITYASSFYDLPDQVHERPR